MTKKKGPTAICERGGGVEWSGVWRVIHRPGCPCLFGVAELVFVGDEERIGHALPRGNHARQCNLTRESPLLRLDVSGGRPCAYS